MVGDDDDNEQSVSDEGELEMEVSSQPWGNAACVYSVMLAEFSAAWPDLGVSTPHERSRSIPRHCLRNLNMQV